MAEVPQDQATINGEQAYMQRFREYVTAGIAGIVMIGTFVLFGLSFVQINDSENFARVKDLLLIANPFVGVVIGYYFNRTTSEARAENAEATAHDATKSAQIATRAQSLAQDSALQARQEANQAMEALGDVSSAAEQVLNQVQTAAPSVLGGSAEGGTIVGAEAQNELQFALRRARQLMRR